jgi:hypothetical protein
LLFVAADLARICCNLLLVALDFYGVIADLLFVVLVLGFVSKLLLEGINLNGEVLYLSFVSGNLCGPGAQLLL